MTNPADRSTIDDPLTHAIALQMEVDQLRADVARLEREVKQTGKSRDKAKQESSQLRARNERLSDKLEQARRDAKQAKHLAQQELQKQAAKKSPKRRQPSQKREAAHREEHSERVSDDGKMVVTLANNQVHISQPEQHYMLSSWPLDETDKHELKFCSLFNEVENGAYGEFAVAAANELASMWRLEHNCRRTEDLDVPPRLIKKLNELDLVLASEVNSALEEGSLAKVNGIGPAAIQQITQALEKASMQPTGNAK
ncbi:hypothetical protein [Modicisalibacter luteus]|uniref:Helix-hairpin-helix domain-containing protein n=1 Tax=Modicisalibacter luteus TaxID=453962 RepID=A0ABV7M250_9GAMM|nr:hypothetical protein [Halomonas lutea]GHA83155.1 hypothetical protein GCM10007159_00050 [Halomonas lutea]